MVKDIMDVKYRKVRSNLARKLESFDSMDFQSCISRQNIRAQALAQNAQYHLFKLDSNIPHELSFTKKDAKKFFKKGLEDVQDAFKWGRESFNGYNFSENFIKNLNSKIVPLLYIDRSIDYRESGVIISNATSVPPSAMKIRNIEMPKFISNVNEKLESRDLLSIVDASIYSHLNLVRIHPFEDGNGRTSRILQNVILSSSKIPLPVINYRERSKYCDLLDDAVRGINMKNDNSISLLEKNFYLYMYEKVNSSLDKVLK